MPFSIARLHKSVVYGSAWAVAKHRKTETENTKYEILQQ